MASQRHVLVVSGSRADYNLLYWPMRLLQESPDFRLSIAVTGMHLLNAFGHTVDQFIADGFEVAARVPIHEEGGAETEMARAIGRGVLGFAQVLDDICPNLMLVLGDRFETLAATQAAFVRQLPIAHLCGGDVTHGALDDGFRHLITKMASLHFVTNHDAERRVRQLGEASERIFNVGSTGIDFIKRSPRLSRSELEEQLRHALPERLLIVTFHPATLDRGKPLDQLRELLSAISSLPPELGVVFTYANADTDGLLLNQAIAEFVATRPLTFAHASLGPIRFASLMSLASAVVGNSSSGLYEAPSFDVPTVNIGRRQEGRLRAASVIDCLPERTAIREAIGAALASSPRNTVSPYGDGAASERIVDTLRGIDDWSSLVYKEFQDLPPD